MQVDIIYVNSDWVEVLVDGEIIHEGHEIPDFKWMELLEKAGITVKAYQVEKCIYCDTITSGGFACGKCKGERLGI